MSTIMKRFTKGIVLRGETSDVSENAEGSLFQNSSDARLKAYIEGSVRQIVTNSQSQVLTNKTIDAASNSISNISNSNISATAAIDASKIADGSVSSTEFQYLSNVTSDIQTQLNSKEPAITTLPISKGGTNSSTALSNNRIIQSSGGAIVEAAAITASRALASDANGIPVASATTATELGYVSGVTSSIQTQLGTKVNASGGTLTNGSIVTPSRLDVKQDTFANLQTYAATASNGQLCFATDLKQTYQIVDGVLKAVGGSGGINYIGNPDFESGTTGYATYADAVSAAPTDGTGGVANITLTASSSSPLRGTKSGLITKDAANRQGQGVSYDFTIDTADQAQILRITFDYSSDSGYADDYLRCYVYDKTNSQLIEVIDRTIGASAQGHYIGTFQSSSNSTSYRLIFHVADSSSTAWTFKFDNVVVGPQTLIKGAIVTDWQSYTPSITGGFGSVPAASIIFKYRQFGDTYEIIGTFEAGTVSAAPGYFTLPNSATIDSAKITTFNGGTASVVGWFNNSNAGGGSGTWVLSSSGVINTHTSNLQRLSFAYVNASDASAGVINPDANVSSFLNSGGNVSLRAIVPILGKSSNQVLSEDTGNRFIACSYTTNSGTALTANVTDIPFTTSVYDTSASWNGTQFTAPETGYYNLAGAVVLNANSTTFIVAYVNGVSYRGVGHTTALSTNIKSFTGTIYLTKGQTLSVRSDSSATLSASTNHYISITKFNTPQTLAGSETVGMLYTNSTQSWTSGAAPAAYKLTTSVFDTHNAYSSSTGVYTVPVSGKYDVKMMFAPTANISGSSANQGPYALLYKNGNPVLRMGAVFTPSTSAVYLSFNGIGLINASKGDTLEVRISQNTGTTITCNNDYTSSMSIVKVG